MRTVKLLLISGLMALLTASIACSPASVDSSSRGSIVIGGGSASGIPANVTVTYTDITTGLTVTQIAPTSSANVNARVTDSTNVLVSGITVTFTNNNPAAGTLAASSATTGANGIATVRFDSNNVNDTTTVTASVYTGISTITNPTPVSLTIGNPPPPTPDTVNLTVTPLTVNIQGTASITASATDATGNAAYSTPILLEIITAGTGTGSFNSPAIVSSITQTSNGSGQVFATFYAGASSGLVTIRATATATGAFRDASVSITSTPANLTILVKPTTLNTGGTANIHVEVTNILSEAVPDGTRVDLSCMAGNCSAGTFPALITTVSGTATGTFTATTNAGNVGAMVIQASAGSGAATGTATVYVEVSPTSSIEFVSATPALIGIKESGVQETSSVVFKVKDSQGSVLPNILVDFQLDGPTGAYLGSGGTGTAATTDQQSTNDSGLVTTILHSGPVAGPARILATVDGSSPPISTSSGNISIGGGVASAIHMTVAVSKFNVAGWGILGATDTVSVNLADRFGNYNILQGTSVSFSTDAGGINTSSQTNATGGTSVTFWTMNPFPQDVPALASGASYSFGGRTYNPEDGYVSIVAWTTGEETFFDTNSNGVYDSGESFTDLGEPYLDQDKDGIWSVGDLFFDWPLTVPLLSGCTTTCGAGQYDGGNGEWDSSIPIWKEIYIVLSGSPDISATSGDTADYAAGKRTSRIECVSGSYCNAVVPAPLGVLADITIPKGKSQTFDVYVSDINMNTLVSGTSINISLATGSKGTLVTPPSTTLPDVFSTGPTRIRITLLNQITETTDQTAYIQCSVTWGGSTYVFMYPGAITLSAI